MHRGLGHSGGNGSRGVANSKDNLIKASSLEATWFGLGAIVLQSCTLSLDTGILCALKLYDERVWSHYQCNKIGSETTWIRLLGNS